MKIQELVPPQGEHHVTISNLDALENGESVVLRIFYSRGENTTVDFKLVCFADNHYYGKVCEGRLDAILRRVGNSFFFYTEDGFGECVRNKSSEHVSDISSRQFWLNGLSVPVSS
jgi:hypothetical protein